MQHEQHLSRRVDWVRALDRFVAANRYRPFAWGVWDCGLMAADAIQAMTGVDLAAAWRGRYRSYRELLRLLRAVGLSGFDALVSESCRLRGLRNVPIDYARRGDLALMRDGHNHLSAGIVSLRGSDVIVLGNLLTVAPLNAAVAAWSV